ncbi:MAG: T9SS type A sorting domain-containing protein [Bacteroidota bacterium]|uniref:T9SS type A sorting domain-containing protein n=1 Tax=Runella sp. TaxID=1960881 RepID=UPI0030198453
MKQIFNESTFRYERQSKQGTPITKLRQMLLLLVFLTYLEGFTFGQSGDGPGPVWTSGVNFNANGSYEDSWAFDGVELPNGNFLIVGYVTAETRRRPGYAVIDKDGGLVQTHYYEDDGSFSKVVKTPDGGYVMSGFVVVGDVGKAFISRLNMSNGLLVQSWSNAFLLDAVPGYTGGGPRIGSIKIQPDINYAGGLIIALGGFRKQPGFGETGNGFVVKINGNTGQKLSGNANEKVFSDINGTISDSKIDGNFLVFTGTTSYLGGANSTSLEFTVHKTLGSDDDRNSDGTSLDGKSFPINDTDVLFGKVNLSDLSGTNILKFNGKQFDYQFSDSPSTPNPNPSVWQNPSCSTQVGPCTPGYSVAKWQYAPPEKNGSPVIDKYLKNNSWDRGVSIVVKAGTYYISAEMNCVELQGRYSGLQYGTDANNLGNFPGVKLKGICDDDEHDQSYPDYRDAFIHIIKLVPTSGNQFSVSSANITHFSGGDFAAPMILDADGSLVIGGNTADDVFCNGLPPKGNCIDEVNMILKVNPDNLQPIWQETYLGYGIGNCTFGITQTSDGGYLLIGNNALSNVGSETFNIVKLSNDCESKSGIQYAKLPSEYIVPQDPSSSNPNKEIWNASNKPGIYYIRSQIIIPAGKTLEIDGIEVRFASTKYNAIRSGITVEQGGRLNLINGAKLTNVDVCNRGMWDGITVEGDPFNFNPSKRGFVYMSGNARIENALRGIVVGRANWHEAATLVNIGGSTSTVNTRTYDDNLGFGGGLFYSTGAYFTNCGKGIVWNPKYYTNSTPPISNVHFEFSAALSDPDYRSSGEIPGAPSESEVGCQLRNIPSLTFSNCTFLNTAPGNLFQSWRNKPTGIFAVDSKISFGGGAAAVNFDNLYNGISSNGAAGGLTATLYANGKFNQVYQGVVVRGDIAPTITGSVFNQIPDKVDSDDGDPAGVFSKGTQGIGLTNNQFYSNPAYDDSYGALINNSLGTGGAEIQFNTFGSFDIANRFEADNTSLLTHCNTYNNDVQKSWNVSGSFRDQIDFLDPTYFPDNKFLSVCDNVALTDIKSDPSFSYYERVNLLPQGINNTTLQCYTTNVTRIPGTGLPSQAQCVIEDPCPDPPRCTTLATKYDGSSKDLRYRNQMLYAYNGWDWSTAPDSNYLPATQKGIALLTTRNQQADKRILAATQTALGNYASAQSWSQLVSGTDAESVDFIQLYNMLIAAGQNGRDVYHLNAQDFSAVSGQLTHTTAASEQVRVLDHILNKRYHPLHAEMASNGRYEQQQPAEEAKTTPGSFKVYPNPFSNVIQFVAPDGTNLIALRIYDIAGNTIYDWKEAKGSSTLSWENKRNSEGVYFYQAYLSSGKVMQGKLIQMKQ